MKLAGRFSWLLLVLSSGALAAPAPDSANQGGSRPEMVVTDKDRQHWSFLPLSEPPLPRVQNRRLVRGPVDRFVLAALEKKGLTCSPEAGARQIGRRLYFDL